MKNGRSSDLVLDSHAILAYLQDEPAAGQVEDLLHRADSGHVTLWLSIINYGEVLYMTERRRGNEAARETACLLDHLPVSLAGVDRAATLSAAHIKATHRLPYADAFAVALAQEKKASVLTGDPEFKAVEPLVHIEWLPQRESSSSEA